VNLKHLLEDIRDSYPYPQEESIITEFIANALDSGASEIRFLTVPERRTMSIVDDGEGMTYRNLEEYHDIAATTKIRGKGIGFAGVGAKLALLVADEVITETKRGSFHKATRWKLESAQRATWEYIEPDGLVSSSNGTAVSIILPDNDSHLLSPDFIERVIQRHFYPILDKDFMDKILKYVYKNMVAFFVNERRIEIPEDEKAIQRKTFLVTLGRRSKPVGIGFLGKSMQEIPEEQRGVALSTYGKVIKRGWDWTGVAPQNPMCLTGTVEIPWLSEILTTNKADFLKDMTSLKKYYRYRKAIQEAMEPILREFGEISIPRERPQKDLRPLEREIERVLANMLDDFPELSPLLGRRRRGERVSGVLPDPYAQPIGTSVEGIDVMTGTQGADGEGGGVEATEGQIPGERIAPGPEPTEPGREHEGRRRRPGLMIGFEDNPDRDDLGWLTENTIWINEGHPAYRRAVGSEAEKYHIVLSVSWVLSAYLEGEKSPQVFINRFLSSWGRRL
ncbi:MAG: ATP-binding protein, partial [Thermodesulforhabdaceae bacterium]